MLTALAIVAIYICGVIAFVAWDAYIGWPVEMNGVDIPPPAFVGLFWPISFPVFFLIAIINCLDNVFSQAKKNRINREKAKEQIRIQTEQLRVKEEKEVEQIFEELEHEEKKITR